MKKVLCAVFDIKTGTYDSPFSVRHTNEALREWELVCKDPSTKYGKHPEDFSLRQIGYLNDESGELVTGTSHLSQGAH